jgi:hypothetical protein
MQGKQPTLMIACAVLRDVLNRREDTDLSIAFMDYGLHLTPKKMRAEIQSRIDVLETPHRILIGFGLCGNGLAGLNARKHTLIIPRVDDCISLFLGSREAYLRAFQAEPGTYYLTPGWLECGGEPRTEYLKCRGKFGPDKADFVADSMYRRYRKVCFIALTADDLNRHRPAALQVAAFCRQRWGWQYEERIGSDALIRRLLDFARADGVGVPPQDAGELLIIGPGGEVQMEHFMAK